MEWGSELMAVREDTMRRGLETAGLDCDVTTAAAMWKRSCEKLLGDAM